MHSFERQIPEVLRTYLEQGHKAFHCEDGDWRLSIREPDPSKRIPAGAIIIADNGVGDVLFLKRADSSEKRYQDAVYVYWHEGARCEIFANSITQLMHPAPKAHKTTLYSDGLTEVRLEDRVSVRRLFRRRTGRVTYIPGVSAKDPEMEHHGLCWVGIQLDDGGRLSTVVDPESFRLKANVSFVGRSNQ